MSGLAARARTRSGAPRRRIVALIVACVAAALAVVAVAAVTTEEPEAAAGGATVAAVSGEPLPGRPPVVVPPPPDVRPAADDRGRVAALATAVGRSPRDVDLRLALGAAQLEAGDRSAARTSFAAAGHLDARDPRPAAALALVDYRPEDAAPTLERLAGLLEATVDDGHRRFVQFALATAELWSGRRAAAEAALRQVRDADPESFYGVAADDLLHPSFAHGYPPFFVASEPVAGSPAELERRAAARPDDVATQLARGAELVRLGRRAEARRVFSALVTANPSNVEARVGLAVAGFSKDRPADAFGRLGPLVRDNPDMASPRLHLALLLTWIGSREKARAEFLQVARAAPEGRLGRLAAAFARNT